MLYIYICRQHEGWSFWGFLRTRLWSTMKVNRTPNPTSTCSFMSMTEVQWGSASEMLRLLCSFSRVACSHRPQSSEQDCLEQQVTRGTRDLSASRGIIVHNTAPPETHHWNISLSGYRFQLRREVLTLGLWLRRSYKGCRIRRRCWAGLQGWGLRLVRGH